MASLIVSIKPEFSDQLNHPSILRNYKELILRPKDRYLLLKLL